MPDAVDIDSRGNRLPPSLCPDCGYQLDCATGVDNDDRPSPGDLTLCLKCTQFLQYNDDMVLVPLAPHTLRGLPAPTRDMLFKARRVLQGINRGP
jgi:hypothetical protein